MVKRRGSTRRVVYGATKPMPAENTMRRKISDTGKVGLDFRSVGMKWRAINIGSCSSCLHASSLERNE